MKMAMPMPTLRTVGLAKSLRRALPRLASLRFAISRHRLDSERVDQAACDRRDVVHGGIEHRFVGVRGMGGAAEFAHELQSGRANFVIARGRLEVGQGFDVPAHGCSFGLPGSSRLYPLSRPTTMGSARHARCQAHSTLRRE